MIDTSKPVKVYRNLKHGRKAQPLYSIMQGGRVVKRVHDAFLVNATFVVNEAGRQRVLRDKRKNVHAFVVGTYAGEGRGDLPTSVHYNPYFGPSFIADHKPVTFAQFVNISSSGLTAAGLEAM